jgi:phytoene synthase
MVAALLPDAARPAPVLEETRFLVEAIAPFPPRSAESGRLVPSEIAWWNLSDRIIWVLELFEELERREQVAQSGTGSYFE